MMRCGAVRAAPHWRMSVLKVSMGGTRRKAPWRDGTPPGRSVSHLSAEDSQEGRMNPIDDGSSEDDDSKRSYEPNAVAKRVLAAAMSYLAEVAWVVQFLHSL